MALRLFYFGFAEAIGVLLVILHLRERKYVTCRLGEQARTRDYLSSMCVMTLRTVSWYVLCFCTKFGSVSWGM
jgi:hypothetical protein